MKPFTIYSAVILFFLGLATPVFAGDDASGQVILGKGTNLAHWLSQTSLSGDQRRDFITEKDIAYIAELGFEHVRMPIDEMQMWDEQGNRDEGAFEILHNAIRELEPERTVMIGSNRWQGAETFDELAVPDDKHIILSYHFYEPFIFTHYKTDQFGFVGLDGKPIEVILEAMTGE